jgi:chloramphenicol 3-O-phosphotransferase
MLLRRKAHRGTRYDLGIRQEQAQPVKECSRHASKQTGK